jgi:cytochrome bd-type quinol oxidase subunit 1
MPPQPTRSHAIPHGLLLGIMAGAVVIGAVFAWLLFSGR